MKSERIYIDTATMLSMQRAHQGEERNGALRPVFGYTGGGAPIVTGPGKGRFAFAEGGDNFWGEEGMARASR